MTTQKCSDPSSALKVIIVEMVAVVAAAGFADGAGDVAAVVMWLYFSCLGCWRWWYCGSMTARRVPYSLVMQCLCQAPFFGVYQWSAGEARVAGAPVRVPTGGAPAVMVLEPCSPAGVAWLRRPWLMRSWARDKSDSWRNLFRSCPGRVSASSKRC